MQSRSEQLAQRRQQLQMQCALERQRLDFLTGDIEARLATADRVLNVVGYVGKNPVLLLATIAGGMILGPWRIMRWVSKGAMVFGMVQRVRQLLGR